MSTDTVMPAATTGVILAASRRGSTLAVEVAGEAVEEPAHHGSVDGFGEHHEGACGPGADR
ncbi:hypothetical protein ACFYO2_42145 [Streptomyces sp. NPDC006602]|uniref:hypothetical protein n=1 Tax=Streptomyces sp. NPDC006602 TaxID=3364751 RepID=UPI0036A7B190